jgi:hypothetical protein
MADYAKTVNGQINRIEDAKSAIISALQECGVSISSNVKIEEIASYIEGLVIKVPYTKIITSSDWVLTTDGYKFIITSTTHGKGTYPAVRMYSGFGSDVNEWQESYYSPIVNISTGDITVYSNTNIDQLIIIDSYTEESAGEVPYTKIITSSDWVLTPDGYKFIITGTTHGKGTCPVVRMFIGFGSNENEWQESYCSPFVNMTTGDVTVYSNTNIDQLIVIE